VSFAFYPISSAASTMGSPSVGPNWSFEDGLNFWTPDSASWLVKYPQNGVPPYDGDAYAWFRGYVTRAAAGVMTNDATFTAVAGQSWTAITHVVIITPTDGLVSGRIGIKFLDGANAVLQSSPGNKIMTSQATGQESAWQLSTVTATAPASTAKAKLYVEAANTSTDLSGSVFFDLCNLAKNG
jgi:hypothetical protein